jgi:hypothetical protein
MTHKDCLCCGKRKWKNEGESATSVNNVMVYFTNERKLVSVFNFVMWVLQIVDIATDLLYITFTPFYSTKMFILSIFFFMLIPIILVIVACRKGGKRKCNYFWTYYLGLAHTM